MSAATAGAPTPGADIAGADLAGAATSKEMASAAIASTPSRRPLRDLAVVGVAAALGAVALLGYGWYRVWDQGTRDEARSAGAIVVLGAAQYDGRPSPVFAARLDHAIDLYERGIAPLLVVTGGKQEGDRTTEADAARRYAIGRGVPEDAIVAEDEGRTTLASLASVGRLLHERGVEEAVYVSDPTHMLRVLRIAADTGIRALGSPTRTSPIERDTSRKVDATIHELGALALYFVAGQSPGSDVAASRAIPSSPTTPTAGAPRDTAARPTIGRAPGASPTTPIP